MMAAIVALVVALLALQAEANFFNNPYLQQQNYGQNQFYNPGVQLSQLENRLRAVEARQTRDDDDLDDIIDILGRQACQTGRVTVKPCPTGFEGSLASDGPVITCITAIASGTATGPMTSSTAVRFSPRFRRRPIVEVSFAGMAMYIGKNCSVEAQNVGRRGADIVFTTDDYVPLAVEVNWFACPGPLFGGSSQSIASVLAEERNAGLGFPTYNPNAYAVPNAVPNAAGGSGSPYLGKRKKRSNGGYRRGNGRK